MAALPLLYGLPKVHKTGVPLRPIVSFVNSPTYHLSKYLSRVLSPLVGYSHSAVRNFKDFVDSVKTLVVKSDESFDVVSLFTNVPTDLAINVARRRLSMDDTLDDRTCLGVDDIISLLELCMGATFLSFRGVFYQQCFGTVQARSLILEWGGSLLSVGGPRAMRAKCAVAIGGGCGGHAPQEIF